MSAGRGHELRFDARVLEVLDQHLETKVARVLERLVRPSAIYTLFAVVVGLALGWVWLWNDQRALYQRVHNAERDLRVLRETIGLTGELERHGELLEAIAGAVGVESGEATVERDGGE